MGLKKFYRRKSVSKFIFQGLWLVVSWFIFTTYFPWPSGVKRFILRFFGAKVGSRVVIRPNVYIKLPWNLNLGDDVWLGYGVMLDNEEMIHLGNSVCVSQRVSIFTGSHDFSDESFAYIGSNVNVGNGSWLAACALVLPGANLAPGSFVKAGTTVK